VLVLEERVENNLRRKIGHTVAELLAYPVLPLAAMSTANGTDGRDPVDGQASCASTGGLLFCD
jgi:hypothetical protein